MGTAQMIAGRFTIGDPNNDLLGRGGMGYVYRAYDTQTGQMVAVKALEPEVVARHPDLVTRFIREGEALRQLNHPNIVKMIAAIEDGGRHYLVMECVPGGSLQDLLEQSGPPPIQRTLQISLDLADALTRAHRLDIIHRDLKPANVLLAEDGTPRLSDFGIARLADSPHLTQAHSIIGTIDYLSPEACRGEELDFRSDIWSFGVMIYELLTGRRPFVGDSAAATLIAILTQPIPDLSALRPEVPDALADLIYRMLEKDRAQRIPSVRLVGAELEALLHGTPAPTPRPGAAVSRFVTPTPTQTNASKHNLPAQPTPFIGREAELEELNRLLSDPGVRLTTILGPGGMGKTRLALEAAAAQVERFEHGVYFVPLAPLTSVDAILATLAESINFRFYAGSDPGKQLLDYLRAKNMLLVMDNFEHLLDGAAIVTDILAAAPGVKVLVTSRIRLNQQGEHVFHITGMDFPDWETPADALEYSAVKLFMQSARRVRPGFELAEGDLKYVARLCRLVGGMPLAILLAAAWVEMLSPAEIAAEVGRGMDFLTSDWRDLPERHRSVRSTLDYSWNMLSDREREVMGRLAVFRGGFDRQAAQEVAGASLRELMSLVNKSLLHRAPTGRYDIHELLRQYALEKLDQFPEMAHEARDRHCHYYTTALARWIVGLLGPLCRIVREEMETEIQNARTAWDWAVAQRQIERLGRACDGLCEFYGQMGRNQEGESACRTAAESLATLTDWDALRVRVHIMTWQCWFTYWNAAISSHAPQIAQATQSLIEQLSSAGQDMRKERADLLNFLGWLARHTSFEESWQLIRECEALHREIGNRRGLAFALTRLSTLAHEMGQFAEARRFTEESLALWRNLDHPIGIAEALLQMGLMKWVQGELEESERLLQESVMIRREIGSLPDIAWGLHRLSECLIVAGKFGAARAALEEGLTIQNELGHREGSAGAQMMLGEVELHMGQYAQACAVLQEALALWQATNYRWGLGFAELWLGLAELARHDHSSAERSLQRSMAILREIGHRENVAWTLAGMGYVERAAGRPVQARETLAEALRIAAELDIFVPRILALPAVTLLLADAGEHERAIELYALASRYGFVANSRWFQDVAGREIAALATALPPETVAAAQARGRARSLNRTVAEWLGERDT